MDSYKDITPRVAVTYDLFGNGKTALKATLGKYLESTVTASNYCARQPDVAHCHQRDAHVDRRQRQLESRLRPANSAARRISAAAAATSAAPSRNLNFGTVDLQQHDRSRILHGWGVRPVGLELGRLGAARGAAAHVGRGRLLPPRSSTASP